MKHSKCVVYVCIVACFCSVLGIASSAFAQTDDIMEPLRVLRNQSKLFDAIKSEDPDRVREALRDGADPNQLVAESSIASVAIGQILYNRSSNARTNMSVVDWEKKVAPDAEDKIIAILDVLFKGGRVSSLPIAIS